MAAPWPPAFLHLVFFLIRGVALHESPSCSGEDSLDECGRRCDTLSCLLFSALWLRCNQSLLVQETQSAKDLDLTCSTTFQFSDVTCLPVRPMSLDWPVDPFASSDVSFLLMFPVANNNEVPFQLLYAPAGDRALFRHDRRDYNVLQGGMDVAPSFLKACDVLLGTPGAWWDLFVQTKEQRIQTQISRKTLGQQQYLSTGGTWKG